MGVTADIVARHHRFQDDPYPEPIPPYAYNWTEPVKQHIEEIAQIVSLADCYDALHRSNNRFITERDLNGIEIKQELLRARSDQGELIERLYGAGIFLPQRVNSHRPTQWH